MGFYWYYLNRIGKKTGNKISIKKYNQTYCDIEDRSGYIYFCITLELAVIPSARIIQKVEVVAIDESLKNPVLK